MAGISPYITLEHVLEQDLYLTFEYVVKLNTFKVFLKHLFCGGKYASWVSQVRPSDMLNRQKVLAM